MTCELSPVSAAEPLGPDQSLPVASENVSIILIFNYLDKNY